MNNLSFDSKRCDRIRQQLDSYLSNELLVETASEVVDHLESCESCSRDLESRMRLRDALQRAVANRPSPDSLRADVLRKLRESQPRSFAPRKRKTLVSWIRICRSCSSSLFAAQWFNLRRGEQLIASILKLGVTDHLICAIKGHNYPELANPPDQIREKLGPRYDIQQAEAQLVAANAEIGVARSAYFPQISLNGAGGFQSSALTSLFTGPAGAWSFGASLTQPIFTGGRLRSQVRLAEARQQTAVLSYQQSIQGAFRDVSDGLVAYRKTREFRTLQELLFRSAEDAARLSHMRYNGGVTGYLEVLTNETNAFSTELGLVQAQLNELVAVVQLYQALGGGWQQ